MEEDLQKEQEKVANELDGVSKEELEAMEKEADENLKKQIFSDACNYVWNLMNLGKEFSQETYEKAIAELRQHNIDNKIVPFTEWDDQMFALNQTIATQGYGHFGTEFIKKVIDEDKESAIVLFETAMQSYLDIRHDYEALIASLVQISNAKEQENKKEEN